MRVIELREETDERLPANALDDDAALSLSKSGHFNVAFPSIITGHQYVIRSKGWVGHIPISSDLMVHVRPKLAVSTIFGMLETAYSLKSFQLLEGETNVETIEELFERVASILAHRVLDRARRGLYQAYLSEREPLTAVRGKIDVRESLRLYLGGSEKLFCEYQQLTHDLEDNQILLWTLYCVSRRGIRRPEVRRAVRQAYRVLVGVVGLSPKGHQDCINRLYHRLNDDYRSLHGLCRLLLEHMGPDISRGEALFLPFKLNMPLLFELFVAEWLKGNAPQQWIITAQHAAKLKASAELVFRIDLLLKDRMSGRAIAVLDTKYKSTEVPTEADIQQAVAYAVEMGVKNAFLVYPNIVSPVRALIGEIDVRSVSFDISSQLDSAGLKFLSDLISAVPATAPNLSAIAL
jgi:5-methylcytosine-specific restriction enzyme subunit McrC